MDKRDQLARLRDLGILLLDLKPDPCDPRPVDDFATDLLRRATKSNPTHIILIKVDVYDAVFESLRAAGMPVIDQRIPFPSSGRQKEFCRDFRVALKAAGWSSRVKCG
jgi:hypothetical protein